VAISLAANATIRVTDSDCGAATNAGPAPCTGGFANTVADIVCGTNATCTLQAGPAGANSELVVTMTGNPTILAAGSTAGAQFPVVVTLSTGLTDLAGNAWDLAGSPDRLISPFPDETAPTSTLATLFVSSGFANTLDTGDKIRIDFSEAISLAANATIRVTDSDCGAATNAGPAPCSGGLSNTVADVICGTNASCTLQAGPAGANSELVVTMTGNPTIVAAGSTAGAQYPVVVTASSGLAGLSGNAWNFLRSPDRVFGPARS